MNDRETYLRKATERLSKSLFTKNGQTVPADVRVSSSLPSKGAFTQRKRRIGECYPRSCSSAKVNEVFVSPTVDDSIKVLGILVHELCHAIDDCQSGHGKAFTDIARAVGLEGKPTECTAVEGTPLYDLLAKYVKRYGDYPHKKIDISSGHKKQTTRQIKIECECGFKVRASRKVIEEIDHEHFQCWSCGSTELTIN